MKRKINLEVLIEIIILFTIANILFFSVVFDKAKYYVHPRLNIYIIFSAFFLLILGSFMMLYLFKPKHSVNYSKYIIVVIPIVTTFTIPMGISNNNSVDFFKSSVNVYTGKSNINNSNQDTNIEVSSQNQQSSNVSSGSNYDQAYYNDNIKEKSINVDSNGIIVINDDDYMKWYLDINKNVNKYEGKTIQFKGQVLRIKEFKNNEFVPARKAMVCCAADLQPCGFLCRYKSASNFRNNEWVVVTAKIHVEKYDGEIMPIIYADKVSKTQAPKSEYVYFK